jgi:hypothetical protein
MNALGIQDTFCCNGTKCNGVFSTSSKLACLQLLFTELLQGFEIFERLAIRTQHIKSKMFE